MSICILIWFIVASSFWWWWFILFYMNQSFSEMNTKYKVTSNDVKKMKIIVTRNVTLCSLVDVYRNFRVQVHQNTQCCFPEGSNLHKTTFKTSCLTKYRWGCLLLIWTSIWVRAWRWKGNWWLVKCSIWTAFQCSAGTLHASCLVHRNIH